MSLNANAADKHFNYRSRALCLSLNFVIIRSTESENFPLVEENGKLFFNHFSFFRWKANVRCGNVLSSLMWRAEWIEKLSAIMRSWVSSGMTNSGKRSIRRRAFNRDYLLASNYWESQMKRKALGVYKGISLKFTGRFLFKSKFEPIQEFSAELCKREKKLSEWEKIFLGERRRKFHFSSLSTGENCDSRFS